MKIVPFFLVFLLSGCASFAGFGGEQTTQEETVKAQKQCSCVTSAPKKPYEISNDEASLAKKASEIKFCTSSGESLSLRSYDSFETAILSTSNGNYKALKRAVSASGVLLVGEGVQVHFKSNEGIYSVSGKDISLKKCE